MRPCVSRRLEPSYHEACLRLALSGAGALLTLSMIGACARIGDAPLADDTIAPITSSLTNSMSFPSPLVLSVLSFEDRTRLPELAWLRKGLADMLVAELARDPSLIVVQRDRVEEIIREQALQLSGRVADETAVRIGRLAGATVLITGSVTAIGDRIRMDAQLVGVEQGRVLGTAVVEGPLTSVPSVTRAFVSKVPKLFRSADGRTEAAVGREPRPGMFPSAEANAMGEALSRQGKTFEALDAFERALAADPDNRAARSNYAGTIRMLSGAELFRTEAGKVPLRDDQRKIDRIIERLIGNGIDAEVGPPRLEPLHDGTVTLRVPVRLRMTPSAATTVVESVQAMGGVVRYPPGRDGTIEIKLSAIPDVNREFVRAVAAPRRIFVRLLSREGRTVAVYSNMQEWRVSSWVSEVDEQWVRIESHRIVEGEAVVMGLTPQQASAVVSAQVTVDAVPHERASVRLDVTEADPARERRETSERPAHLDQKAFAGPPSMTDQPALPDLASLRGMMEEAWNPPITERSWSQGYLPGNERTAVITLTLEKEDRGVREEPRLAKSSGDNGFDLASLAAARRAVQRWLAESATESSRRQETLAPTLGERKDRSEWPALKIRAQFHLVKDVPALNLIGPQEAASPLNPFTP